MSKTRFVYYLRATLDGRHGQTTRDKPYRGLAILENQSLSTLARAIVTSFGFYFDHCYGFYNNLKSPHDSKEMYELFTDISEDPNPGALGVTYVKVSKAFDNVEKKLLFLFDYGDTWYFLIELINIKPFDKKAKYPKISKKVGKSPEQYPTIDAEYEEEFIGRDTNIDTIHNVSGKRRQIVIASKNKISDDSYELVKTLLAVEGALITNESILEDFMDSTRNISHQEEREFLCERIAEEYGVVLPEILKGETRVWEVVKLIYEKQRESLLISKQKKERLIS